MSNSAKQVKNVTVAISGTSEVEIGKKKAYIELLIQNLDTEALEILAKKSTIPGISAKLKSFQSFIK